jgi:hypothetical protein
MVTSQKFLSEQDHYDQSITYSGLPLETQVVAKHIDSPSPKFWDGAKNRNFPQRGQRQLLTKRFSMGSLCFCGEKKDCLRMHQICLSALLLRILPISATMNKADNHQYRP